MRRLIVALMITLSILAIQTQPAVGGPIPMKKVDKTETTPNTKAPNAEARAAAQRQHEINVWIWYTEINKQKKFAADLARLAAHLEAQRREAAYPTNLCGGDLPPCRVLNRESKGDIRIWNSGPGRRCYAPIGWRGAVAPNCPGAQSSASGKWQFIRRTWAYCRTGYVNAADAPARVQDACARIIKRVQPRAWG